MKDFVIKEIKKEYLGSLLTEDQIKNNAENEIKQMFTN